MIVSRSIHVAANDIIPSPLICLLNSSLASHHLQGPVKLMRILAYVLQSTDSEYIQTAHEAPCAS